MSNLQEHFKAFECILTYAVDEYSDSTLSGAASSFSEEEFYHNVYVARPEKEKELELDILNDTQPTYFIGQPGTGKTTILRRVVNKIKHDRDTIVLHFDFKVIPQINSDAHLSFDAMLQFLTDQIRGKIANEHIINKVDIRAIITFFLDEKHRKSSEINNPKFTNLLSKLNTEYSLDFELGTLDFNEWVRVQFYERLPENIKNIIRDIDDAILPHNLLYYLTKSGTNEKLCIITFDNVDSILNNEIRSCFMSVLRSGLNSYKNSSRIVCTIREKNIVDHSDIGSYIVSEVNLDYDDLINEPLLNEEIKSLDPNDELFEEEQHYVRLKYQKKAREKFANLIYERRFKYFKNLSPTADDSMDDLHYFYQLILEDAWLPKAFLDLSNLDRRSMLVNISSFISYMAFEENFKVEDLRLDRAQIETIIQTCFYAWIKSKQLFYEDEIYNLPNDIYNWRRGNIMNIHCNFDHLLFCVIFNLSQQEYPTFNFGKKAKLAEVIKTMSILGYDEEYIKQRIHFLYRKSGSGIHKGLIEFYNSNHRLTKEENEQIALTPRSYYLLVFSSLKFASVFADLREIERKYNNDLNTKKLENDLVPVTKPKLLLYLKFLIDLASYNLIALSNVKRTLVGKGIENWLNHYRKYFCLKISYERVNKQKTGDLLFNNLIVGNIKFLYVQQKIESDLYLGRVSTLKNEVIAQFAEIQNRFKKEVDRLAEEPEYYVTDPKIGKHIQLDTLH